MSDELDDLLDERRLPEKDVAICLDLTLLAERDQAMKKVQDTARAHAAQAKPSPDAPMAGGALAKAKRDLDAANAAVHEIEQRIASKSIVLRIFGVDRVTYNQWMLACPPRKGRQEVFDPTKFYMHAAKNSAKFVSKKDGELKDITAAQWFRIDKTITDGEHDRIASAVIEVNRAAGGMDVAFFGAASPMTPDSSETSD